MIFASAYTPSGIKASILQFELNYENKIDVVVSIGPDRKFVEKNIKLYSIVQSPKTYTTHCCSQQSVIRKRHKTCDIPFALSSPRTGVVSCAKSPLRIDAGRFSWLS